jgi:hypothetical protein
MVNQLKRALVAKGSALATLVLVGTTQVHAALPSGSAEAIDAYKTDVVTVLGLLIAAGIAIFAVRKLGQKMGWL